MRENGSTYQRCPRDHQAVTITGQRPHTGPSATFATVSAGPFAICLDATDSHADALAAMILANFVNGTQPWARTQRLDAIRADALLLPPGIEPAYAAVGDGHDARLAIGDGWTLLATRWRTGGALVRVIATTDELAQRVLAAATRGAAAAPKPGSDQVEIGFWHLSGRGPRRQSRAITAQPGQALRAN